MAQTLSSVVAANQLAGKLHPEVGVEVGVNKDKI